MTFLENKKPSLGSYYEDAKKAIGVNNIEQALLLTERGRIEAELENDYEWIQRFTSFNAALTKNQILRTTIGKEDISKIKGVGSSITQKLREHGFSTLETIAASNLSQLSSIKGIGPTTAQKIVKGAKSLTNRKKLNDFSQPVISPLKAPLKDQEEGEEFTEEDYNSVIEVEKERKCSSDKFQRPKTEGWYPPRQRNLSSEILEVSADIQEFEELTDEIAEEEIVEEIIRTPKEAFIEEEPIDVTQLELKSIQKPLQEEKLNNSERHLIEKQVMHIFQNYNYTTIIQAPALKEIFTYVDLIAVKKIEFTELLDFIVIIPLKINRLKGGLQLSNTSIKYTPIQHYINENDSAFKILLDLYFDKLQECYDMVHSDLVINGNFHSYLKRHCGIHISTKKTLTRKTLFFIEGNKQLKVLIEPVLLCQNKVGFLEKDIPFAYLNDTNLHVITQTNLSGFIEFIEQKYTLLETYYKQNHSFLSYNESYSKFLRSSTMISAPFMGFGILLILLIIFQSFETLKILLNIGYALLTVFFITILFFYLKVLKPRLEIQAQFSQPHYAVKPPLDNTSLELINEHIGPEMMLQFGYECLGKDIHSKVMMEIEQEKTKERIECNRLEANMKNGGFFEKHTERKKDLISKYGSFLED
ncbi:MAG: helix-hairpin-helix domain-containing protein [Candidatus Thorarchaeota archaeon]